MKSITILAAAAVSTMLLSGKAPAGEMSVEQIYGEIEAAYGVVPSFMKAYPRAGLAGAWALTKGMELNPEARLDPKVRSLINVAVAAQIPCRYCIWLDTRMAKQAGASDEEIAEAVAQAGLTRHWSAVLNGLQIDFEQFKAEFGGD